MRYLLFFTLGISMAILSFTCNQNQVPQKTPTALKAAETSLSCDAPVQAGLLKGKMKGMSFVAPPSPFVNDPMTPLKALGIEWIAALPYSFFRKNQPSIGRSSGGWWGERPEGICETIRLAHAQGIKVMLKPQLWTFDQWIGELNFETTKEWEIFEENYTQFIMGWAKVADSMQVDLFCIGTEIRHSTEKRPQFWRDLIDEIKTVYQGKLTYAPNWDDYDKVTFWDKLDYIGTDAYFPLLPDKTPSVCQLKEAWKPTFNKLKAYAKKWDKPMLFTEFGYMSMDGCAHKTWELEKNRGTVNANEVAQANAIQALLETFGQEDWWAGGFQWKWYPSEHSAMGEGKQAKDYTPQGKQTEQVLKIMYQD